MQTTASETIEIAADPSAVYGLVSDLSRMGDWSPECVRCELHDDHTAPVEGATFQGFNAVGDFTWDVACRIIAADPGKAFAFQGPIGHDQATTWRYTLEAVDGGTRLTESFDAPMLADASTTSGSIPGRDESLRAGMRETLTRIKAAAEA